VELVSHESLYQLFELLKVIYQERLEASLDSDRLVE
jgi:hypothetical protein